ncbi:response regulator [Thioalkalivibrio sp.]|uniref:response regulator n=1 Tax=Thioalkalivibrio sp. TaxID=2093813 RepID=UPI0012D4EE4B|nr:response regulator [Thioalkalivibrio sp.]TVP76560.1 MAG: response regulator [Thioalkalivibrio sp.]
MLTPFSRLGAVASGLLSRVIPAGAGRPARMAPTMGGGNAGGDGKAQDEVDIYQTLERLASSEAALKEAQAIAHLGSWALDYRSGELTWSDEAYRLLGFQPGAVVPSLRLFLSAVHAEDRALVEAALEAAPKRADGAYSVEHRVQGPDGILRVVREKGRVRFGDDGEALGISGTALDITEQRHTESDLLQRERLERGLLELSAVFLQRSELGMDHLIDQALERMGQLTGTDRTYLFTVDTERRTFSNTHEWTAPGITPVIDMLQNIPWDVAPNSLRLLASGSPVAIPQVSALGDDWVEKSFLEFQGICSLLLLPVMQGENLTGFVGFDAVESVREWSSAEIRFLQVFASLMVSVIEREQAYADMVAARERETIGHLASGVAHDFNNLLGVIDANFFYLRETLVHSGADSEIAQILEETHSALGQAKVVTSGMLSLSRAGSFATERVLLAAAIEDLARILRQVLPPEIRLVLALEPDLAVLSNNAFLQAALLNLALNARDAMPEGGQLTIETVGVSHSGGGTLTVGNRGPGRYARVRVTDTGCGMGPETLDRLFEPLFSTKAQQRGHGLGLFMVHEFVLRSGALLEVDSRVDEGSEFRLFLPSWPSGRADFEERVGSDLFVAPVCLRVLVVDDDLRSRDSVARLLEMDGMRVETAEDGEACLEVLRQDPGFDLVLSDVSMPRLDGVGLCGALLEAYPALPVILMTGQAPSVFPQGEIPGAPTVLRKPLDLQILRRAIASLDLRRQ